MSAKPKMKQSKPSKEKDNKDPNSILYWEEGRYTPSTQTDINKTIAKYGFVPPTKRTS